MIYLDYAATTPMSEGALQVYNEVAKHYFGNTNSLHDIGTSSKDILEQSKYEIGKLINAPAYAIHFTSGGTESNTLALETLLQMNKKSGKHLITTAIEHSSIYNFFKHLELTFNYSVTFLGINEHGEVNLEELDEAITDDTILVSIQHANSEIGAIQPLKEIGQLLQHRGVFFHSDCVQTFGKIPIDLEDFHVDSLSISGHKIYGPKGVGAIYMKPGLSRSKEKNHSDIRSGTIDLPGIAAFVSAAQESCDSMQNEYLRFSALRETFIQTTIEQQLGLATIQCHNQMPHIIGILFDQVKGDYAMLEFNRRGVAISTGSACTAGQQEPSRTILALGHSQDVAKRFIRLSLGKDTTKEHLETVIQLCTTITSSY